MPAKKNPITEAERSQRFVEKARELGCEETTEAFDRVLGKILPAKRPSSKRPTHRSEMKERT